jgi:tetratricopeptide (TPR) repeat protein
LGKIDKAENEAAKVKDDNRHMAWANVDLAHVYERQNLTEKAKQGYEKAISLDPTYVSSYDDLSLLYCEQKEFSKAMEVAKQGHKSDERDPSLLARIGYVYEKTGDFNKAVEYFNKAIETATNYSYFDLAYPLDNLGWTYLKLKNYDKALESYRKLSELLPADINAKLNIGYVYSEKKEFSEAINIYNEVLAKQPNNVRALVSLSYIYRQLGQYDQSIEKAEKAISLDANDANAYINLGGSYLGKGMRDKALEILKKAIYLDPTYAQRIGENYDKAYYNRGTVLASQGKLQEAVEEYKISLMINPNFADSYYNLACAYSKLGNIEQAIRALESAIHLNTSLKNYAKNDSAFNNIKDDERFISLVNR